MKPVYACRSAAAWSEIETDEEARELRETMACSLLDFADIDAQWNTGARYLVLYSVTGSPVAAARVSFDEKAGRSVIVTSGRSDTEAHWLYKDEIEDLTNQLKWDDDLRAECGQGLTPSAGACSGQSLSF